MIKQKALVIDRGKYTYLAQELGKNLEKVWYCQEQNESYPESQKAGIGKGLDEIEVITNVEDVIDKADYIFYPDCYNGKRQAFLREKGYNVAGSMLSEQFELDRYFMLDELQKKGMNIPATYRAEGLDDLCQHLEKQKDAWLKRSYFRGDFETYHYRGMHHFRSWLYDLRARIGVEDKTIEILAQKPIKKIALENLGRDTFRINDKCAPNPLIAYEEKDQGLIGKIFSDVPDVFEYVDKNTNHIFEKLGYYGHYSYDLIITEDGDIYLIDPCCRAPSPPSGLMCELYDYSDTISKIAHGIMPDMKYKKKCGATLILKSEWHKKHELCVEYPKEIDQWVKLRNQRKEDKYFYCVPNGDDGYFGEVVGVGDTLKEAQEHCKSNAEQIIADELCVHPECFEKIEEQIKKGEKFGVKF
jgi:hypothetical protein